MNKDIFKTSEEREWILQEVKPFLHKKASFQCFHDGIFCYRYKTTEFMYVFDIIADDCFNDKMEIEWMLDVKRVKYFSFDLHLLGEEGYYFFINKTFNVNDNNE